MKRTILAVDDDEGILELIKHTFTHQDYLVHTAENARTCLKLARKIKPELILLDVNLVRLQAIVDQPRFFLK